MSALEPASIPAIPAEFPPRGWHLQAKAYAVAAVPRRTPRGLLLYGQGRTGSNLVGDLLCCHPRVEFGNEVLAAQVRWPDRYVEGLRTSAAPRSYAIHVKRYHLTDVQGVADPRAWLHRMYARGWQIAHVTRANPLLHMLSNFSLNVTSVSHVHKGEAHESPKLIVDPADLLEWIEIRSRLLELERLDLQGLPHTTLIYEQDLQPGQRAWSATASELFDQLGLSPHSATSTMRKVNPPVLEDLLQNADEVRAAVAASRWHHLLAGDPEPAAKAACTPSH